MHNHENEEYCDVCNMWYVPEDCCHYCHADWKRAHNADICPHWTENVRFGRIERLRSLSWALDG